MLPQGVLHVLLNILIAGTTCCRKCCIIEVTKAEPAPEVDRENEERHSHGGHLHIEELRRTIDLDIMPPLDLND